MGFTPDPEGIEDMACQLGAVLQKVIDDVAREMAGQPAQLVEAEIARRAQAAGLNYTPGKDLHIVAAAIEADSP